MSSRPLVIITDHLAEAGVERGVLDPVADVQLLQTNDEAVVERSATAADALLVFSDPMFGFYPKQIANLAVKSRLPAIYGNTFYVESGGLMSYGSTNPDDHYRRAAVYVDKILKGATPAELPVERPMKLGLVINLKAAKQIGLTIPQSVLYRADKVIK